LSLGPTKECLIIRWENLKEIEKPSVKNVIFKLYDTKEVFQKEISAEELINGIGTTLCIDGKTFKRIRQTLSHKISE